MCNMLIIKLRFYHPVTLVHLHILTPEWVPISLYPEQENKWYSAYENEKQKTKKTTIYSKVKKISNLAFVKILLTLVLPFHDS